MNAPLAPAIAIVGLACRYADAGTPQALWQMALAQRRAFRRLPRERLNLADYAEAVAGADGTHASEAAVLHGWHFDRERFRIPAATVRASDPAHWLALEVAADALADAGFGDGAGLPRLTTGVVIGNTLTGEVSRAASLRLRWPYARRTVAARLAAEGWPAARQREFLAGLEACWKAPFPVPDADTLAGGLANTIAGRICNHYDLGGGGWSVDGACASSLLAIAQACSALAAGDLDVAIAGGVDLSLDPFELVGFARVGALAREDMRVFDAAGTGFWPGEGCGLALLMRAADARAQGLRPYALIRGWAVASDGSGGLTRPEVAGQRRAIECAWQRAGRSPADAALFECHGTGTAVGDPVELQALAAARGAVTGTVAAVGSIKANIGHTKAAAGAAGLIKTALALREGLLPPTTGCRTPHPLFAGAASGLRVLADGEPWPDAAARLAGVSGFGFGGIDVHLALSAADEAPAAAATLSETQRRWLRSAQDTELLLLAAPDAAALDARIASLAACAAQLSRAELVDLACTLSAQADARLPARAALLASTPAALVAGLARLQAARARGETALSDPQAGVFLGIREATAAPPRVLLLFPGQAAPVRSTGGAWARRYPEVARLYEQAEVPAGDPASTAIAQPAIVTASLAALAVLERAGLRAVRAIGHSLGELLALHWAGAFDAACLLRLACARGRVMAEAAPGAMASLACTAAEAATRIAGSGARIAARNGPQQTVIAGSEAQVTRALAQAGGGVRLPVGHAFHTPAMAVAAAGFAQALAAEAARGALQPTVCGYASTVRGRLCPAGTAATTLLLDQLSTPVDWQGALAEALDGIDLAIEAGPGALLGGLVRAQSAVPVLSIDAAGASLAPLLGALGAAWAAGCRLDARALDADREARPFPADWHADFLVTPCEAAAPESAGAPALAEPVSRTVPAGPAPEAGVPEPATGDTLALLARLFAARAELPAAVPDANCRPLADLHLNSIAVGQVVVQACRALGLPAPVEPTQFASADLATIARALDELRHAGSGPVRVAADAPPAGVDAWVRTFVEVREAAAPLPAGSGALPGQGGWQLLALPGDALAARLAPAFAQAGGGGLLLCLPSRLDAGVLALLPAAVAALDGRTVLLLASPDGGWGGWARTLWQEQPATTVCVLELPADELAGARALAELAAAQDFHEVRYEADGRRTQTRWQALVPAGAGAVAGPVLGAGDVLLVSGGGKGIAAECARALALAGGAKLLLLGRADPADDPVLAGSLVRLRAAGIEYAYVRADVADAAAVRRAVAAGVAQLGPVTALLHGAGRNQPQPLLRLTAGDYAQTLAPKDDGLGHLLAAIEPARLRLLVAFGSVIARCGLPGEADYALANEWLARRVEAWALAHPHCRCRVPEWSIWSGTGMGERLGRVEALARAGITAIPPQAGVAALEALLATPEPGPVRVTIAGRLPESPALRYASAAALPLRRFLEHVVLHVPGVELITEARLLPAQDPYLADHVLDGTPLLPGVLILEALAQLAGALTGHEAPPCIEAAAFLHPVAVPAGGETIRLAALRLAPDSVEVVLRCAGSDYAIEHARARCHWPMPEPVPAGAAPEPPAAVDAGAWVDAAACYDDGLLFQRGRLRRVLGYGQLEARTCRARIGVDPQPAAAWFGRYLPPLLLLGDPGLRDAALHALQACIPHRRLVPCARGRGAAGAGAAPGPWGRRAPETAATAAGRLSWTLVLHAADGRLRERWDDLVLADLGPLPVPTRPALLGPYLQRRSALGEPEPRVVLAASRASALAGLGLTLPQLLRRADGRPEANDATGRPLALTLAHAGGLTLAALAGGCDLEIVAPRPPADWHDLLGPAGSALARTLAAVSGEDFDLAATRVWGARECLKKAGLAVNTPLTLVEAAGDAVRFAAGGRALVTIACRPDGVAAVAALLAEEDAPAAAGARSPGRLAGS
ncbi:SDR family NAD(P)-dependent oxidoreductase [Plasticicumulans sp.]|uniref:SDR family NAD(P)-dependent oxidoreductase n=2 Tax=Plasticicumulans sp. TaxID=2307179 RepID=UPI003953C757